MKTIVTFVSVAAALVWSAVVWGGYGLLVVTSDLLTRGAVELGSPYEIDNLAGLIDGLLRDYGVIAAGALWALGILGILLLRGLANWLIGSSTPRAGGPAAPARDLPRTPAPVAPAPRPVAVQPEIVRKPVPPPPAAAPVPEVQRWGRNAGR